MAGRNGIIFKGEKAIFLVALVLIASACSQKTTPPTAPPDLVYTFGSHTELGVPTLNRKVFLIFTRSIAPTSILKGPFGVDK